MSTTAQVMAAIVKEVSGDFLERDEEVRAIVVAMLAEQHSLLLGAPGAAKSDLARAVTGRIEGATYWTALLGAFSTPTQIFGPVDIAALMRGEYRQVLEGHAARADVAFIDEIFKCGEGALNSMLGLLNEREYAPDFGGAPVACPLLSAVTASNELPSGQQTEALYDRIMVRLVVDYIEDQGNFRSLLQSGSAPRTARGGKRSTVTLEDLTRAIREEVPAVAVPDGTYDAIAELRTALGKRGLVCSDRRWRLSVRLLQASAWLAGRAAADDTDLEILRHVLWDRPGDRRAVAEEVLARVNPDARKALDHLEGILQVERGLDSMRGKSVQELSKWAIEEGNPKMKKAVRALEALRDSAAADGRSTGDIDDALRKGQAVWQRITTEALGMPGLVA